MSPAYIPPREAYEANGWNDGRLGQINDLLEGFLTDQGEKTFRHPLLKQITDLDKELAK